MTARFQQVVRGAIRNDGVSYGAYKDTMYEKEYSHRNKAVYPIAHVVLCFDVILAKWLFSFGIY